MRHGQHSDATRICAELGAVLHLCTVCYHNMVTLLRPYIAFALSLKVTCLGSPVHHDTLSL